MQWQQFYLKKYYVFWGYAAAFLMKLFYFCSDTP